MTLLNTLSELIMAPGSTAAIPSSSDVGKQTSKEWRTKPRETRR